MPIPVLIRKFRTALRVGPRRCWAIARYRITPRKPSVRVPLAQKYLSGQGIEIGALHLPLRVSPAAQVKYVDRLSLEDLRAHYPELADLPLVAPDILDDGETLGTIADASQNFVIANHVIEHCQNPIETLCRWLHVLKPGGILFMAVPDKRHTFDRSRPLTSWVHLLRDYRESPARSRHAHYLEWAQLMLEQEQEAAAPQDKKAAQTETVETVAARFEAQDYSIHFHVWDRASFQDFLTRCQTELGLPMRLVDYVFEGIENICIIERT